MNERHLATAIRGGIVRRKKHLITEPSYRGLLCAALVCGCIGMSCMGCVGKPYRLAGSIHLPGLGDVGGPVRIITTLRCEGSLGDGKVLYAMSEVVDDTSIRSYYPEDILACKGLGMGGSQWKITGIKYGAFSFYGSEYVVAYCGAGNPGGPPAEVRLIDVDAGNTIATYPVSDYARLPPLRSAASVDADTGYLLPPLRTSRKSHVIWRQRVEDHTVRERPAPVTDAVNGLEIGGEWVAIDVSGVIFIFSASEAQLLHKSAFMEFAIVHACIAADRHVVYALGESDEEKYRRLVKWTPRDDAVTCLAVVPLVDGDVGANMAVNRDGTRIAIAAMRAAGGYVIYIYDVAGARAKCIQKLKVKAASAVAWSADGALLYADWEKVNVLREQSKRAH